METIELTFANPNNPALGGVANGREAYDKQVRPRVSRETLKGELCIRFPKRISIIGNSFIRGFARPMIDQIGLDGVRSRVHFVTSREELTAELYEGLL
ncbi:hypothetical protein LNP00_05075 [Fructobacillus sp. M158]|uniref:hypothetical protein n=1 Tax=Fructobacillus parabroussonetiae TaxID=2713174 RepID=UPI00200AC888|nr:hypothetical protein [Fructobacillus parabroussonetiae]MCK8617738.1 hypothetical protein [Fructobacillus parabroussonetiae]